jgi:hypothetical protein
MKESNKYCVFAFKDHYVNQSCIRKHKAKMSKGRNVMGSDLIDGGKLFSASGYCVFSDCPVEFIIKMNTELQVHVFYQGKVRHSINEVNARYFRGKVRQELRETLKNTTPMREYLHRIQNSSNLGVFGNVDYVGKSSNIYRKISSEAKDQFQSILQLRSEFIEASSEFIQMIQHIPGSVVCYCQKQINLFHNLFIKNNNSACCLYINCFSDDSYVITTMNSEKLYFYEMCLKDNNNNQLIPLSCSFFTKSNIKTSIKQWLTMFFESDKSSFINTDYKNSIQSKTKYILCDISINSIDTILKELNNESFQNYSNRCFLSLLNESNDDDFETINNQLLRNLDNKTTLIFDSFIIHSCTKKVMDEISKLCRIYYQSNEENINNFNFGIYAFNVIVNSQNLIDLQRSLYAFMCILYSDTINSLVKKSFDYLKLKLNQIESLNKDDNNNNKINETYLFNFKNTINKIDRYEEQFDKNIGLSVLKGTNIELDKLNETSIFYKMCDYLFEKCKLNIDKCQAEVKNLNKNPRKCHDLLFHFLNQFSSTLHLWTKCLVKNNFPITSTIHTDRFQSILASQNDKKENLHLFIKKIYQSNESIIQNYSDYFSNNEPKRKPIVSSINNIILTRNFRNEFSAKPKCFKRRNSTSRNDLIRIDTKKKKRTVANQSNKDDYNDDDDYDENEIIIERECEIKNGENLGIELSKSDLDSLDTSNSLNANVNIIFQNDFVLFIIKFNFIGYTILHENASNKIK